MRRRRSGLGTARASTMRTMRIADNFNDLVIEHLSVFLIEQGFFGEQAAEKSVLAEDLDVSDDVIVHVVPDTVVCEGIGVRSKDLWEEKNDLVRHSRTLERRLDQL
jgi:hypothetical protein